MREDYSIVWTEEKVDKILTLDRRRTGRQLSDILRNIEFQIEKLPSFLHREKEIKDKLTKACSDLHKLRINLSSSQ